MFSPAKIERRLSAIAVSRGIGIGTVVFYDADQRDHVRKRIDDERVPDEILRLESAIQTSTAQLRELAADNDFDPGQPVSGIFGVHLSIIEESSFIEKIATAILDQKVNAEWAIESVTDHYRERQIAVLDDRFKEKHLDIEDVSERILTALDGAPTLNLSDCRDAVVIARQLRPSAVLELSKLGVAALVTERGGWTSHSSILAREFRLPMVSGVKKIHQVFAPGDYSVVDGYNGEVVINPETSSVAFFSDFKAHRETATSSAIDSGGSIRTQDGVEITVRANTDIVEGYRFAQSAGARGIGLFRSESLIRNQGSVPSEDDQFEAYARIADATGDSPVRIRTYDIAAGYIEDIPETNAAMGLRSIRLSLVDQPVFRSQIRAVLRASVNRNVELLFPMISGVGEIIRAKAIIDEEKANLSDAGIDAGNPRIGAMIEVPSAVLTAGEIAKEVDFLCLGTNDLVQYLLAVDRDNDAVAEWYQSLHPAVLRSISVVLDAGSAAGIPVAVCGEIAGSPFYVPLLIGLGARELSVNVNSILQIRQLVEGISAAQSASLAESIRDCRTAEETESILRKFYSDNWAALFTPALLSVRHR